MKENGTVKPGGIIRSYRAADEASGYFFAALLLFILSALVFALLVLHYFTVGSWRCDSRVFSYLQGIRSGFLDAFFKTITQAGNTVVVIIITLAVSAVIFFALKKKEYIYFLFNILGAWLLNETLKAIIRRPRPVDNRLIDITQMTKISKEFGFPSGHSMVYTVFGLLLIYFILLYSGKRPWHYILCFVIAGAVLLISLSRVYLGVHYFSDVAAGWTVGILWTSGSVMLHRYRNYRRTLAGRLIR